MEYTQYGGLSITAGNNTTSEFIPYGKQIVIYYTADYQEYLGSITIPANRSGNWFTVYAKNSGGTMVQGYFLVNFTSGTITSSTYTNSIIKIVGYDVIM